MTRAVIRRAAWSLGANTDEDAPLTTRETACSTCHQSSEANTEQLGPDGWALEHAGRTGHTEFTETMRVPLRATPRH